MCAELHHNPAAIRMMSFSYTALIPKVGSPESVKDYRPISLQNVLFKIFTKVLANRLKPLMEGLIDPTQSAFIKGRSILDGVAAVEEAIYNCKKRNKEGIMIKLDFEKAFDMVRWDALTNLLQARGFGSTWIGWVTSIATSARMAFLVNGTPTGYLQCAKGLRQGDPLSPLLFILLTDGLSRMLRLAHDRRFINGLTLDRRHNLSILNLQYADDTILFSEVDMEGLAALKVIILLFEGISGMKVNYHKSYLYLLNSSDDATSRWFANGFGCQVGKLPISYLGIPIRLGKPNRADWSRVITKIERRLALWKGKLLSLGGRLVLLNSVLDALPTYILSIYRMPAWVRKEIDRLRRRFLWTGGDSSCQGKAQVAWRVICRPKEFGGWGILDLNAFNVALLAKWWWKLASYRLGLHHDIILAAHGSNLLKLRVGKPLQKSSFFWKGLIQAGRVFRNGCLWKIGNGLDTSFWADHWYGEAPLNQLLPQAAEALHNNNYSVQEMARRWPMIQATLPPTVNAVDIATLRDCLFSTSFTTSSDRPTWKYTTDQVFSVRSCYKKYMKLISKTVYLDVFF